MTRMKTDASVGFFVLSAAMPREDEAPTISKIKQSLRIP